VDPNFDKLSPEQKLARFRHDERHPLQGSETHIVTWLELAESKASQRALFYAALKAKPELVTTADWRDVRADEQGLIEASCDNRGAPGVPFELSEQECAKVSSSQGTPPGGQS